MKPLDRKIALVTGASSGIGAAIAREFAAAGADVIVNYHGNAEGAQRTAAACTEAGVSALVMQADVGSSAELERMFAQIDERFGRIDIWVNNAGITPWMPLLETPEEVFDSVINTNLRGVFLCSQQSARRMIAQGDGGSILNVSSVHAAISTFHFGVYAASKGGIEALTRVAAVEWGEHNIRVNALRVGWILVERDALRPGDPGFDEYCMRKPLRRVGQPEEVARMAVAVCSDMGSYVTGAIIPVDGGISGKLNIPEQRDAEGIER